jgi:hypothetical protein
VFSFEFNFRVFQVSILLEFGDVIVELTELRS